MALACPSGDLVVAAEDGTTAVAARYAPDRDQWSWTSRSDQLDVWAISVAPGAAGAVFIAGTAAIGTCGAVDPVGNQERKSFLAVLDPASGEPSSCTASTVFPYSGNEQNLAAAVAGASVFTAGWFETCGFGNYVNVVTRYDLAGGVSDRASEPGVDLHGATCIGPSIAHGLVAGVSGELYIVGLSALAGENGSHPFVERYDNLTRIWKSRSTQADDYAGVAADAGAVYAVGSCGGQACIETWDAASGAARWGLEYSDPAGSRFNAIAAPGNGVVYAVGTKGPQGSRDVLVVAADAVTGDALSLDARDVAGDDSAFAIAVRGNALFVLGDAAGVFLLRYELHDP